MRIRNCAASVLLASSFALAANNEVTLAWEASPRTFDPRFANDANSQYLVELTNCSLINFDRSGNLIGQLASSWSWTGPKTLLVTLRNGAKFSDGTPVTPEDVVATYSFLNKPNGTQPSPLAGAFSKVQSIKAMSANQVQFELQEADSSFIGNLFIGILPKELASRPMLSDAKQLKGCGPFLISNVGISDYSLTRNEKYSLGDLAKPSKITIKIVKDDTTRFSKLLKGELDLVQNGIGRDQLKSISSTYPTLTLNARPGLNVSYVGFNFRDKFLAKKEVRQAISLAINRDEIIKFLLQGMAEPANNFLSSENPFHAKGSNLSFDLAQANALLDKAGLPAKGPEKIRFDLQLKTTADVTNVNIAYAIAGHLHKLGIKVQVQALEWGKFKSDVDKGAVQIWLSRWIGYKDPDIYRYAFASESFPPHGGNRGWYSNPQLDKILEDGRRTHEIAKRKPLYAEVQKIVDQDLPYAFLWHEKNFVVYNKSLKGFELYADGRYSSLVNVTK